MVKGVSRQVIVLQSPDPKLFEQAIFILKDEAIGQEGITNEALLKEANRLISSPSGNRKQKLLLFGPMWACCGALMTGLVWLMTSLL